MDYQVLGKNIRAARKALKMTQERLSELADISTVFISQIENGVGKPSLETIYKLSLSLDLPIDELVKNTNDIEPAANTAEMNSLLIGRTTNEIKFVTRLAREALHNLDEDKIDLK